ncbi:MAG: hypothetical protein WBJ62_08890 [Coriobacteriia bacterium]
MLFGAALLVQGLVFVPAEVAVAVPLATAVPMNQQDTRMWMTSDVDGGTGTVSALDYASDGTLYIGGEFTHVGPPTGGFGAIGADGRISGAYPYVDGQVFCSVADGSGGFYIGGDFTSVGGVARQNLARINADGTLNVAWNPGANSDVWALAIDATYVYAGGNFSTIGGQSRTRLARINRTTGEVPALFNPAPNNVVRTLALVDSTLYLGGDFTSVGGVTRNRLGAVSTAEATLGEATTFDPNLNGKVHEIVEYNGALYVGGEFTQVGATSQAYIARFTRATGLLATSWNPVLNGAVNALAVQVPTDGSPAKVLIGGSFLTVDGEARARAAALYHADGELYDVWTPHPNNRVETILVSGDYVYVGGVFTSAAPSDLPPRLMRFGNDGNLLPDTAWAPMPVGNGVYCLTVSSGDIGVGGAIASVGAHPRKNIAALDSTGALKTGWYPTNGANAPVRAIDVSPTSRVFVGGEFTTIGGQARNRMAELNTSTGAPLAFNPNLNGTVYAIESRAGDPIYVGGQFTLVGGVSRWNLAALDTSGALTTWCSTGGADGTVRALALDGTGGAIYVGGDFGQILSTSRYRLARLATASTTIETWDAALSGSPARVNDILVTSTAIYAGGQFTHAGGSARANLAALSPSTAAPTSWAPNPNVQVQALAKSGEADVIIIGGAFSTMGGQDRPRLAAVRPDGTVTSWTPEPSDAVSALAASDTGIVAGGGFEWLRGDSNNSYWQAPVRFPFDDAVPSGTISINGGAASTTSASVTITIGVTDDSDVVTQQFSTTGASGPWTMPEPLTATKSYTLPAGDGTKTVWARFVDESGNVRITSDSITLTTPPATPMPVYRFYRPSTGTHFYTADATEMARVRDTMSATYSFEGVGYSINTSNPANSVALYRFYNVRTGTHLYTADVGEKNTILATLSGTYSLDGVAYNVSMTTGTQVYRFYSPSKGVHFYSSDPTEIAYVRANLGHVWSYEGPAYRVGQ